jgi:threonine aldolase
MPSCDRHQFASDNTAGICPEAGAALAEANQGAEVSYGDDPWTKRVGAQVREIFETDCQTFIVFNGTAANALGLAQLARFQLQSATDYAVRLLRARCLRSRG